MNKNNVTKIEENRNSSAYKYLMRSIVVSAALTLAACGNNANQPTVNNPIPQPPAPTYVNDVLVTSENQQTEYQLNSIINGQNSSQFTIPGSPTSMVNNNGNIYLGISNGSTNSIEEVGISGQNSVVNYSVLNTVQIPNEADVLVLSNKYICEGGSGTSNVVCLNLPNISDFTTVLTPQPNTAAALSSDGTQEYWTNANGNTGVSVITVNPTPALFAYTITLPAAYATNSADGKEWYFSGQGSTVDVISTPTGINSEQLTVSPTILWQTQLPGSMNPSIYSGKVTLVGNNAFVPTIPDATTGGSSYVSAITQNNGAYALGPSISVGTSTPNSIATTMPVLGVSKDNSTLYVVSTTVLNQKAFVYISTIDTVGLKLTNQQPVTVVENAQNLKINLLVSQNEPGKVDITLNNGSFFSYDSSTGLVTGLTLGVPTTNLPLVTDQLVQSN